MRLTIPHLSASRVVGIAVGLLAAAALACVSAVGPPVVHLADGGPRVVAAIRAGYPELCHEWRDKLVAQPSPASWYTSWDVSCVTGIGPGSYPLMTVNVVTCQWHPPLELSLDWNSLLTWITQPGQPLRRCP